MNLLLESLGWVGSFIIVIVYGLNSYQKIKSDSLLFYSLNLVGGLLLIIYSNFKGAYANTFINVIWVLIALPAIFKILKSSALKRK